MRHTAHSRSIQKNKLFSIQQHVGHIRPYLQIECAFVFGNFQILALDIDEGQNALNFPRRRGAAECAFIHSCDSLLA